MDLVSVALLRLGLGQLQRFLLVLALGDVANRHGDLHAFRAAGGQRTEADLHRKLRTIFAKAAKLAVGPHLAGSRRTMKARAHCGMPRTHVDRHQHLHRLADEFIASIIADESIRVLLKDWLSNRSLSSKAARAAARSLCSVAIRRLRTFTRISAKLPECSRAPQHSGAAIPQQIGFAPQFLRVETEPGCQTPASATSGTASRTSSRLAIVMVALVGTRLEIEPQMRALRQHEWPQDCE
jgi:hypothetical protein